MLNAETVLHDLDWNIVQEKHDTMPMNVQNENVKKINSIQWLLYNHL